MNILVFSDTHLTHRFDERKYNFLHKIISDADRVIINGDFWDGYLTTFNKFIHSSWKKLFLLLKSKKTVYIYGNHDAHMFSNQKVSLFSVKQVYEYTMSISGKQFVFEHGHRLFPLVDTVLNAQFMRYIITKAANVVSHLLRKTAHARFHNMIHGRYWQKLKNKVLLEQKGKNKHQRFFGHIHYGSIDHTDKLYNSGTIQFGHAQYIVINDKGVITLHEEKY